MSPLVVALLCTNEISDSFFISLHTICEQDYDNITIAIHLDGILLTQSHYQAIRDHCLLHKRKYLILHSLLPIGLTRGLLKLQQKAPADFYARLDVGDMWATDKVSKQIQLCIRYSYSIVGTISEYIDSNSNTISFSDPLPCESSQLVLRIRSFKGLFDHSSILFEGKFLYDADWYFSQDMKLYVDIANSHSSFGFIPQPLTKVKFNPLGITITKRPLQLYY